MAASTITRSAFTDGTTPWNASQINGSIYDKIDQMFGGTGTYATLELGGALKINGALTQLTNDGGALGTSSLGWSDLFLASGAVINLGSGDVTLTHSTNGLGFAGASSGYTFDNGNITQTRTDNSITEYRIINADAGASAFAQFVGDNNARAGVLTLRAYSSGWGSSIPDIGDSVLLRSTGAGGLTLSAQDASGIIRFSTGGVTERMRLTSGGQLQTSSTISVGNATPSTSGAGITFPASQSASSDANTLDDYEEGTFTATLKGSTSDPTTPVTTTGYYTKIGRQVSLVIAFQSVNTTGAAGTVTVTGIPAGLAPANVQPVGAASAQSFTTGAANSLACTIAAGSTTLDFYATFNNGAIQNLSHNAGTTRFLFASITYFV